MEEVVEEEEEEEAEANGATWTDSILRTLRGQQEEGVRCRRC